LIKGFSNDGHPISKREYDLSKPKGYNIVAGKLSFEVSKILNPNEIAPTLVAMDMQKLYVVDKGGIRRLSLREGLRLCGYPETYKFEVKEREGFDLLGNTVVVPVIKSVAKRLISTIK
jgi:DNA (cytosine-5)-methyltransferase 1